MSPDADQSQIVAVLSLQRCDRRRFSLAVRSPRRPEPQQYVATGKHIDVKCLSVNLRNCQCQHSRPIFGRLGLGDHLFGFAAFPGVGIGIVAFGLGPC